MEKGREQLTGKPVCIYIGKYQHVYGVCGAYDGGCMRLFCK